MPSAGATSLQRVDRRWRPLDVGLRLVAPAALAGELRLGRRLRRQRSSLRLPSAAARRRRARAWRLSYSMRETRSRLPRSSLARSTSYFAFMSLGRRCSAVIFVLRQRSARSPLRRSCSSDLALHQALVELRRVELDDHVPLLHRRAVLHELDDLQLAAGLRAAPRARSTWPDGCRRGSGCSR